MNTEPSKYLVEYWNGNSWEDVHDTMLFQVNPPHRLNDIREYCRTYSYIAVLRIVAEFPTEWEGDPTDEGYEEATDWEYATYAIYVNGAEYFPNPSPITVYVRGGYVQNVECPDWLDVDVQDYDANPELDPLTYIEVLNDDE